MIVFTALELICQCNQCFMLNENDFSTSVIQNCYQDIRLRKLTNKFTDDDYMASVAVFSQLFNSIDIIFIYFKMFENGKLVEPFKLGDLNGSRIATTSNTDIYIRNNKLPYFCFLN